MSSPPYQGCEQITKEQFMANLDRDRATNGPPGDLRAAAARMAIQVLNVVTISQIISGEPKSKPVHILIRTTNNGTVTLSVRYGVALETPLYPETVECRMIGLGYDQKVREARNLLRQWETLGPYGMPGLEILVDMAGVKYGTIGHQYIMPELGRLAMQANHADVLEQQANADLLEQPLQRMNISDQQTRDKAARDKEARNLEKDGWFIE